MVSSHICNASVSVLVKTTHVIDKLLSDESTVLTRAGGGKHVRPKSMRKDTFSGRDELLRSLN